MSNLAALSRKVCGKSLLKSLTASRHRRSLATLPSFSLEGKTCVVTGAARGLGKEFLTAFALSGARGACVDLSLQGGKDSIKHITEQVAAQSPSSSAPDLRAYACNVSSESQVQDTWASIVSDFGKVDIVVPAAGIVHCVEAEKQDYDRWKQTIDVNLNGTFLFAREAGKYWINQTMKGNLILVSSISSVVCVRPQKQAAYNASKGAVSLLGRSLATEWGAKGIRVNMICPGYMKTDMMMDVLKREGPHLEENWIKDIPMGRMAHPSELRGTIVWMASDASSYLNGSDIVVDGGYCCW